ncbi:hypothetical protein NU195Hw_g713t1 [Hortaea werneckii]
MGSVGDPTAAVPAGRPRRMTLPKSHGREDPVYKQATMSTETPAHGAAFIFIHGLGDDAKGLEDVADQFQKNSKLPYMNWILPNGIEDKDAMQRAWYRPTQFKPFPADRPELKEEEDEEGMRKTVQYIESLIDACVNKGIPPNRIILGGFSQGAAISMLTDLTSAKYGGKLAGIVSLMGYLPLADGYKIQDLRAKCGLPPTQGEVPCFLARGKKDQLIPARIWEGTLKKLEEMGLNRSAMDIHEYDDLGHSIGAPVLSDLCTWMQRVVPKLED